MAALGHAPFHLWYVAFAGFAAVFWAVSQAGSRGHAFRLGWLAGVAYFAVALHWIVEPFLVDAATHGWMAPGALVLLAGGLALFWGLAGWSAYLVVGRSTSRAAFSFAVTLVACELLRGHAFTGFPWATPAYIWTETPVRMASAYLGTYGLTFATLLCAASVATARTRRLNGAVALVAIVALFGAGQFRTTDGSVQTELGRVGIVHPNVPQTEKWVRTEVPEHIDRMLTLTRSLAEPDEDVDMIVWPEVSVVYPLDTAGPVLTAASAAAQEIPVMLGINRREDEDWYNALIELDGDGSVVETYDKVHLVPFGEYIPFRLGFLRAMAATSSNGFSAGEAVRLLDTPLGKALPLICYEGIFPGHVFQAKARADYILLVTNDAWFGTFAGPFQHLDQARFRAAEQGLPVVRAANAGVSTVIDRYGNYSQSLGLNDIGSLSQPVVTGPPTLYARTGDLPLYILLVLTLGALTMTKSRNSVAKQSSSV
ncbi:MAG: apolipoprotein N-acyltransferase [Pseudomonadota bacterium]